MTSGFPRVRGFIDQGAVTTPFDMVVLNRMSRFHLALEALKYVPRLRSTTDEVVDLCDRLPLFVNAGERIKVDPREGRYISRA